MKVIESKVITKKNLSNKSENGADYCAIRINSVDGGDVGKRNNEKLKK